VKRSAAHLWRALAAALAAALSSALGPALAPALVTALVAALAAAQTTSARAATPPSAPALDFSAEEHSRILAHGPWPPPRSGDAGNRVDGQADAIELGRRLFFDKRLSGNGQLACASCHNPQLAFQDGRRFSRHGRNTLGLLDAGQQRWFGWDGAKDSLWAASLSPLTAADEMATTAPAVRRLLQRDRSLGQHYRRVFGPPVVGPPASDELLLVNLAKALAAYQATLVSARTPFDEFRDALARNDAAAAARYPAVAQRGLKLFVGAGRCFFCHAGPGFSNGEFADVGRPFFSAAGADPGRWGGLQQVLVSPYNRLGSFSDAGAEDVRALGTRHVLMEPRHFGEFKVPTLRSLTATSPYFHDGSARRIEDVVRHYSELDESRLHADGVQLLQALKLTPQQAADLAAFLRSLSPDTKRHGQMSPGHFALPPRRAEGRGSK
jgi:cytochrome c peroxidase